jgi:hypothetical protein
VGGGTHASIKPRSPGACPASWSFILFFLRFCQRGITRTNSARRIVGMCFHFFFFFFFLYTNECISKRSDRTAISLGISRHVSWHFNPFGYTTRLNNFFFSPITHIVLIINIYENNIEINCNVNNCIIEHGEYSKNRLFKL